MPPTGMPPPLGAGPPCVVVVAVVVVAPEPVAPVVVVAAGVGRAWGLVFPGAALDFAGAALDFVAGLVLPLEAVLPPDGAALFATGVLPLLGAGAADATSLLGAAAPESL